MNGYNHKRSLLSWTYPFLLGVFTFNILRAITDFTKGDTFWGGGVMDGHFIALLGIIIFCYQVDWYWRQKLGKRTALAGHKGSVVKEYLEVFGVTALALNISIWVGEKAGILYMGNGIVDYMLSNISFLPFLLLYYTFLRNDIVDKHYTQQKLQFEELKSKQLETELNYLKAQYHPHFLFNALNTIYFQIDERNAEAKRTVELLSELLRYQLYAVNKLVMVAEEIEFTNNYIRFQQLRMTEELTLNISVDPALKDQRIHPLLFQPLLENAFKYVGGEYLINIDILLAGTDIQFTVVNSLPEMNELYRKKDSGIGLENLKRRLDILYPGRHVLKIKEKEDQFSAWLTIEPEEDGN